MRGNVSGYSLDPTSGHLTAVPGSPFSVGEGSTPVAIKGSNQVAIDATGALTAAPGSPFDTGAAANGVVVDLTGSFVYVASGNHISGFAIDPTTGTLTSLAGSPFPCPGLPYGLSITPHLGYLVAGNDDHTVQTYSIDPLTGALAQMSGSPVTATNSSGLYSISFSP